jgi:tripartite-type tricarboxylate transporter receptor subunit TctC
MKFHSQFTRLACFAAALALPVPLLAGLSSAHAADTARYPARPIKFIAPSPPGGPPDLIARLIGDKLADALGKPVTVENRPGAGFTIGLNALAKSAPDGYTLGILHMPATVTPSLATTMPYDTEKDLAAVSLVAWSYNILAVSAGSPVTSLADLVATAKAKPGTLKFSSAGNGTPAHLAGELLKREAGIDAMHIPYQGAAAAAVAVLNGDVDMMIGAAGVLTANIKSGRLRALATPAPQRFSAHAGLPTFAELGYPGIQIREWLGVVAPAGTPKELIERLHAEIARALSLPEIGQRLAVLGMEPAALGPAEFSTHIRSELQRWAKFVREAKIESN